MAETKYKSKKVTVDGIEFDSKEESLYYLLLKKWKDEDKIKGFELQPKYQLQPKFSKDNKNDQPIYYVADFLIYHVDDTQEVIDIKGMATETALLKRKLFDYNYPNLKLSWIIRNLKYGDSNGYIDYFQLKKIRAKNKKLKGS